MADLDMRAWATARAIAMMQAGKAVHADTLFPWLGALDRPQTPDEMLAAADMMLAGVPEISGSYDG